MRRFYVAIAVLFAACSASRPVTTDSVEVSPATTAENPSAEVERAARAGIMGQATDSPDDFIDHPQGLNTQRVEC